MNVTNEERNTTKYISFQVKNLFKKPTSLTKETIILDIDDFDVDDAVSANDDDAAIIEVINWLTVVFAILEIVAEAFPSVGFGVDKCRGYVFALLQ